MAGRKAFRYTDQNPPPPEVMAKYDVVIWDSPHGLLQVDRRGNFMPISEDAAMKILGPAAAPSPSPSPSPTPETQAMPSMTESRAGQMSTAKERGAESRRAKAEQSHQETLDKAKFAAPTGPDPLEGLGLAERAKVEALIRGGMSPEEAIASVRGKPPSVPAAAQAGALREQ